jgi:hypothetical protein
MTIFSLLRKGCVDAENNFHINSAPSRERRGFCFNKRLILVADAILIMREPEVL